ncbi:MAG: hypothetical protein KDD66_13895, partial [Bdellovibrionales bacterium]|nr:hypothetical protein [Bdellovibrionales bacterium]
MKRIGLLDIFALIVLLSLAFGGQSMAGDPGVGWHLLNGKLIVDGGSVPRVDEFLARDTSPPWVANQWLSDVLLYLMFAAGDWAGVHLFVLAVFLVAFFGVLTGLIKENSRGVMTAFVVALLVLLAASVQLFIRPVVFSFLLFALCYRIVRTWLEGRIWPGSFGILLLPLIFALWANLHPAFPLGGLVLIAAVVQLLVEKEFAKAKRGIIIGMACLSATLINPYGLRLYTAGAGLVGDSYFMNLNVEWYSVDTHQLLFGGFAAIVFSVLILSSLVAARLMLFDRLLLLLFVVLAVVFRRYIPFCAIVAATPLAVLLSSLELS